MKGRPKIMIDDRAEFRKKVEIEMIRRDINRSQLCVEIARRTGLYVDSSYISKILSGARNAPRIVEAIREILEIA